MDKQEGGEVLKNKASRIAFCGIMTALAMVFGYVEYLLPLPIGIYGVKLGLANLVVLIMLYSMSFPIALTINLTRIFLSFLLFGTPISLAYSLCGGVLSFFAMLFFKTIRKPSFSPIGISILGGVMHNVGQILAAVVLLAEFRIAFYLPVLVIIGALTGTLNGIIASLVLKHPLFSTVQSDKQ